MQGCVVIILFFLFGVLFAAFFILALYLASIKKRALYQQFNSFAQRFGAPVIPPKGILIGLPYFNTTYNSRPLHMSLRQTGGRHKTRNSRFEMNVNDLNFEFLVTQQDFITNIGKFLGMNDLEVGDFAFDKRFVIKTNLPERFTEIFNQDIRSTLISKLQESRGYSLRLINGRLSYETIGEFQSESFNIRFASMVELAAKIADQIDGQSDQLTEALSSSESFAPPVMALSTPLARTINDWPEDEQYLKRLTRDLIGGQFRKEEDRCFYPVQYRRRELVLEYFHNSTPHVLNISMTVIQKFWLRMLPQTGDDIPDEIRVSDPLIDRSFRIHSDQREAARRFLESIKGDMSLSWLLSFNRFEINKGRAMLTITDPKSQGFLRSALEQTLNNLLKLLQAYEEQRLALSVSQSESSNYICPYCREDLDAENEAVVNCKLCHTAHHQSCLNENKQCTTWGCLATESDFA